MCLQTRALTGVIGAFSDMNTNTYAGHAFRLRTSKGALLLEYVATPTGRMSFDTVRRTHVLWIASGSPAPQHRAFRLFTVELRLQRLLGFAAVAGFACGFPRPFACSILGRGGGGDALRRPRVRAPAL